MVDFLGAKTKKNRQQSEEMKARERRNSRGPYKLMLYIHTCEHMYALRTRIFNKNRVIYFAYLYRYLQGTFVYSLYSCVHVCTHNGPTYYFLFSMRVLTTYIDIKTTDA